MIQFTRHVIALSIGAAVCSVAPMAYAQNKAAQTVQLSAAQMKEAAAQSLRNGDTAVALRLADALLLRDPDDVTALLIQSHSLRKIGKLSDAQKAARAAWQNAEQDKDQFSAAMLMAQALSSDGKRTRAQLWLRRAAEVAPTKGHAAKAARDFRYVRRQNPWQTQLSFTLAPNSNINNGSSRDSSSLLYELLNPFGIAGANEVSLGAASKALSGIEAGGALQTRYRFHQTESTAHDLRFGLSYRTYQLSQSSKDDLEAEDAERIARGEDPRNIKGSDFSYGTVQLGYGFKKLRADKRGEFSLTADVGQSFYGGSRYNHFFQARAGQSYHKDAKSKFNYGLSTKIERSENNEQQNLLSVNVGLSRKLSAGNGLYLGAVLSTKNADLDRLEYDEFSLRSGYVLGREILGTKLQFGLNTSYRDYDVSLHDPSGRRDFTVAAEVTATFKQIDYYGFNPTVSFSAATTNSNIGLYDVNRVGLGIGVASSF
ncbi:MAG: surface lipoprotein assembly modifier [Sulfitobacter sp.]